MWETIWAVKKMNRTFYLLPGSSVFPCDLNSVRICMISCQKGAKNLYTAWWEIGVRRLRQEQDVKGKIHKTVILFIHPSIDFLFPRFPDQGHRGQLSLFLLSSGMTWPHTRTNILRPKGQLKIQWIYETCFFPLWEESYCAQGTMQAQGGCANGHNSILGFFTEILVTIKPRSPWNNQIT